MQPETLPERGINAHQRIKDLMEENQLADQLGLHVFGIGGHHRPDYTVSSSATILAAAAVFTMMVKYKEYCPQAFLYNLSLIRQMLLNKFCGYLCFTMQRSMNGAFISYFKQSFFLFIRK